MSETSSTQIHLLNLTARPVQLRVSLHPGIRDYFRDGGSHKKFSSRIREVLNAYFFAHATLDDIRQYLGPYEQLPEGILASSRDAAVPASSDEAASVQESLFSAAGGHP
jgi:hypothetical protein